MCEEFNQIFMLPIERNKTPSCRLNKAQYHACLLMKQEHPCVSFARHTTHPYCEVVYVLPQDLALVL